MLTFLNGTNWISFVLPQDLILTERKSDLAELGSTYISAVQKVWAEKVSFLFEKAELKLNGTSRDRTQILCTETQNSTPELTRLCPRLMINLQFIVFKASFDKKAMKMEEPFWLLSEAESCLFFCALESFLDDFYTFNFCYRFQHAAGIEPSSSAPNARVLPLSYQICVTNRQAWKLID